MGRDLRLGILRPPQRRRVHGGGGAEPLSAPHNGGALPRIEKSHQQKAPAMSKDRSNDTSTANSSAAASGYADTQRIDWLEEQMGKAEVWVDGSGPEPRFSVDGAETWHDSLRPAIDAAMSV